VSLHDEHGLPIEILRDWTLAPDRVSLIAAAANVHWRVDQGSDSFVARRYRAEQSASAIEYEFHVLRHLHERGWPVAAPVREVAWFDGVAFALFPALAGAVRDEGPVDRRERGRILAMLHRDLDSLDAGRQRDGWLRADEVVAIGSASLEDVGTFTATCERIRDRLAALDLVAFPIQVVHGDFIAKNLLFGESLLTGVLDFDATHVDLRAVDVACARRSRHDEVVQGYMEITVLSDDELACLDDLWRAAVLAYASHLMKKKDLRKAGGEIEWCRRQIEQTLPFEG
jgi:Ser/Thr protein kinase RdoA (MazF antagonist)